ncbi:MAG: ribbon-helix-helix domain-containing protein [Candidatus Methylophosphatis roskildensis]
MSATFEIKPELQAELEKLARSTRRDQSDLANEAIRLYLEHETSALEKIRTGLAQAERGEFVPDAAMEAFFAQHAAPEAR